MSIKILFCDNSLRELLNFRENVIRYYVSQGCEVILVAPDTYAYRPESFLGRYIPVKFSRSGMNPIKDLSYFFTLCRIYRTERPDYIFHYTIKPNIYGTLAARVCGIPSTAMIAGLGYIFYKKNLKCLLARSLYKWALKYSEKVLVLNEANKRFLLDYGIVRPTQLIHLQGGEGVDLARFSEQQKQGKRPVFLMIARLLYDKGYREYVEAAKRVKELYPEVEFQVLGDIDLEYPRHVPEEVIKQDHASAYIVYLGYAIQVEDKIRQADCVVLPSYYNEGLSRVLMEATAMGKPVITCDIPGCREAVEEGVNGFLVPPRDVDALVEAFKKMLMLTPQERKEMGKKSRQKAEQEFDIQHVIAVYRKIIKG